MPLPATVRLCLDAPPQVQQLAIRVHRAGTTGSYCFDDFWCFHCYRYRARLELAGASLELRPGQVGFTAPGVATTYHWAQRSPHGYAHFRVADGGRGWVLPALLDLGEAFEPFYRQFEEAVGAWSHQPRRAEARLWDLLWQVVERAPAAPSGELPAHPALRAAVRRIELGLSEPLAVGSLATAVGLSHNQLTRMFRAAFGTTVVGYIRRRRFAQAQYLLQHTAQPIKAIAAEVGLGDLQRFNKLVRRETGQSPRAWRSGGHAT
ncbi:MAG: helix-turn-helix transcriptional regulator [Fimbriimonadaceae bacterium]|nr:helix-turn-helix transcriptional regulator [Fimbriimonadaceae bacterium]